MLARTLVFLSAALACAACADTSDDAATDSDEVVTPDNANDKIEALIAGAKHEVLVYDQSLGDDAIVDALIDASKRGAELGQIFDDRAAVAVVKATFESDAR